VIAALHEDWYRDEMFPYRLTGSPSLLTMIFYTCHGYIFSHQDSLRQTFNSFDYYSFGKTLGEGAYGKVLEQRLAGTLGSNKCPSSTHK
jgi:hypothetical protein